MEYLISFINTIFPDTQTALVFILISLITLWMYKELRTNIVENGKNNVKKLENAIEIYSELDSQIRKILKEMSENSSLDIQLNKAAPYLPYDLFHKLQQWEDTPGEFESLKELQEELRNEFRRIKQLQLDPVSYKYNGGIIEFLFSYIKRKFSSLIEPLFLTLIGVYILIFFVFILMSFTIIEEFFNKILLLSLLVAVIVFIVVIDMILSEVLLKSRFVHSILNWITFISFFTLNSFLFFIGPWYRGLIIIVVTFAYAFYATTFSIKNIGRNKKN